MYFANPMALLALLSIPAILVMYLLKQKYKETPVPSLFLWRAAAERSDAARPFQKLRRSRLLFLQLLAALLLSLALAQPKLAVGQADSAMIIVIDASLSMQAADVRPNRFEQARAEARKLVESLGQGGRASIVVLCAEPYVAVGLSDDKQALLAKINGLEPSNAAGDMRAAAELVHALAGEALPSVYLLTDSDEPFASGDLPVSRFLLGESTGNAAVTRVSYSADGETLVCLVQVKNYGAASHENTVALYADGKLLAMTACTLAPGEERDVYFSNVPADAAVLMAKLTEPDALEADNTAWACIYPAAARKTILFTARNVFLENILAILPNVELYTGTAESLETASGYHLYVYDGMLPQNLPEDGHILVFNPPAGNALLQTGAAIDVSDAQLTLGGASDLLDAADFAVREAKAIVKPEWADVALRGGDAVLALSGQKEGRRIVVFAFDLHDTDLPLRKEFPVFMYNLCNRFMPAAALMERALVIGDTVDLQPEPDASGLRVAMPDGARVVLAPPFPVPPFTQTAQAGVYTIEQTRGAETAQLPFAVNIAAGADSSLLRETPGGYTGARGETLKTAGSVDLGLYCMLAFMLCLTAEWWVYSRG